MTGEDLIRWLRERPRAADGAMGTALYNQGIAARRCFDELNRTDPGRVEAIHAGHLAAGAEAITTNTFGANRLKLERHGLAESARVLNRSGAEVARRAAKSADASALVLGSVGPTGASVGPFDPERARELAAVFREQVEGLVEGGVDALLLETFTSLTEAMVALGAARETAPDAGIVVLMTFSEGKTTELGVPADRAARELVDAGAHAVGSNCGVGPDSTLAALSMMRDAVDAPLVAKPNAGIPGRVGGRFLYPSSPDYVAHYAKRYLRLGASLIGGCCGTGSEHAAAVSGVVRAWNAGSPRVVAVPAADDSTAEEGKPVVPVAARSRLAAALAGGEFVASVEMDPPRGADPGRFLTRAARLRESGARFVNVADGPRATARMSAIAFSALLERGGAVETILHYQCRDRNLIGIQADLLGAQALGIRNVLAVTGDPPKLGDYPHATPVFDVDSVGLVRILGRLNRGQDLVGNDIGEPAPFHVGVGANPAAADFDAEIRKFERKCEAGAEYCLTQPVYELAALERFLAAIRGMRIPVLVGVLPLASSRNAEFLHNEVPGMSVPERVRALLAKAGGREEARRIGVEVAREMVAAARDVAEGVYVMPPFNRFDLAQATIEGLVPAATGEEPGRVRESAG